VSSSELVCRVQQREQHPKPARRLTLLVGMTKADKPDLVVRMTTELGVSALRFVTCKRSVVRNQGRNERFDRLRHIALEACAQSGNPYAPEIVDAIRLVFWERADTSLPALPNDVADVWAIVGPEGGLDGQEVAELASLGYVSVALGTPILRAETAAITIAARLLERLQRS
jgi:16S rRNA (uracil1498-N3)-methyltransferase